MNVFVRDDIDYIEKRRGGFDVVSIDGELFFNKTFVGQVCTIIKDKGNYVHLAFKTMYQTLPKECIAIIIPVEKVGENRGFCREYFKNKKTNAVYARQEGFKGKYEWFSCTKDGEPDCHLKDNLLIYDVENEKLYKVWKGE